MAFIKDGADDFITYPAYRAQFPPACPEDIPGIVPESFKQAPNGDRTEVREAVKEEEGVAKTEGFCKGRHEYRLSAKGGGRQRETEWDASPILNRATRQGCSCGRDGEACAGREPRFA